MPNEIKAKFLENLKSRFGSLRKLQRTRSLYEIGPKGVRVYIRYSKLHDRNEAFYGLRKEDVQQLEGHASVLCFLWDGQDDPLVVPFSEYEDVFQSATPAADGQYKVMVYPESDATELYIARAGRFNVEAHRGWNALENLIDQANVEHIPEFTHEQMQTLLGSIGHLKGYDIWVPQDNRATLDWSLTNPFQCRDTIPYGYEQVQGIVEEVDVVWIRRGASELCALFEVEHSTPIYSALLRFNDIHLAAPSLRPRLSIVSNEARRSLFVRQLNRPTFRMSGLSDLCNFLEYANVYGWFNRTKPG